MINSIMSVPSLLKGAYFQNMHLLRAPVLNVGSLSFLYPNIWLSKMKILLHSVHAAKLHAYVHVDVINYCIFTFMSK